MGKFVVAFIVLTCPFAEIMINPVKAETIFHVGDGQNAPSILNLRVTDIARQLSITDLLVLIQMEDVPLGAALLDRAIACITIGN